MKITDVGAALDPQFERVDTPITDVAAVLREYIEREMDRYTQKFVLADHMGELKRELAEAVAQRDKAMGEADAMDEFLGAASRHEKEASAIINALTADIHITVPLRDYTEMSPKDCYELGMMDGVAALKSQINAAIDAAMKESEK